MTVCYRCRVYGRVQGVFFRGTIGEQARELGVTGYAMNLPDGSVETLLCGEASAVKQLREWLWKGPQMAKVESVVCEQAIDKPPIDFLLQ